MGSREGVGGAPVGAWGGGSVRQGGKDVSLVEQVVVQDVRPHIIEALHVLVVPLCEVEPDALIGEEAARNLLDRVPLEVEEDAESIQNLALLAHLPELLTQVLPIGGEFQSGYQYPGSILCTLLNQLDLLSMLSLLLFLDYHVILAEHYVVLGFGLTDTTFM